MTCTKSIGCARMICSISPWRRPFRGGDADIAQPARPPSSRAASAGAPPRRAGCAPAAGRSAARPRAGARPRSAPARARRTRSRPCRRRTARRSRRASASPWPITRLRRAVHRRGIDHPAAGVEEGAHDLGAGVARDGSLPTLKVIQLPSPTTGSASPVDGDRAREDGCAIAPGQEPRMWLCRLRADAAHHGDRRGAGSSAPILRIHFTSPRHVVSAGHSATRSGIAPIAA